MFHKQAASEERRADQAAGEVGRVLHLSLLIFQPTAVSANNTEFYWGEVWSFNVIWTGLFLKPKKKG